MLSKTTSKTPQLESTVDHNGFTATLPRVANHCKVHHAICNFPKKILFCEKKKTQ